MRMMLEHHEVAGKKLTFHASTMRQKEGGEVSCGQEMPLGGYAGLLGRELRPVLSTQKHRCLQVHRGHSTSLHAA
jgi:hypothetical protein